MGANLDTLLHLIYLPLDEVQGERLHEQEFHPICVELCPCSYVTERNRPPLCWKAV